jgi:ABC-2 type transport system ATP-binding protein
MPEVAMENALDIHCLNLNLGRFALRDLAFVVPRGAITGLVGANGAGKSTLMKLILGLRQPDSGSIHFFGEDAQTHGPRLRARIGFVQESPTLPMHLRIGELAEVAAPFYPTWNPTLFQRLMELFEIPRKTSFGKLSQGNRMKAALCLAMAHEPELLLLDEPTSGLDPASRRDFLDLLLEIVQDERRAVLFSTHIVSDLDRVADHLVVLKHGRVALAGAKDELLEDWHLVKGGEELLPVLNGRVRGGQRTELGLELLVKAGGPLPSSSLVTRLRLEDLVDFLDRPLDDVTAIVQNEEASCLR